MTETHTDDGESLRDRVDRQAATIERQERLIEEFRDRLDQYRETVEDQRAAIDDLERRQAEQSGGAGPVTRRGALKAGGVLAALGLGVGTASADPSGQVGTEGRPLETLYADALTGPLTGGQELTSLVGDGLTVEGETLTADVGSVASLSVTQFDVGGHLTGDAFTVTVGVAEAAVDDANNLATTVEDAMATLTVSGPNDTTEYDQEVTTDIPPGGTLVTFGVDGTTDGTSDEVGPLDPGDYTATVTVEADNTDAATATDTFTVWEPSLDVTSFSLGDKSNDTQFTVDAGVARTNIDQESNAELAVADATVMLTVEDSNDATVYEQELTTDVSPGGTVVTFGVDDSTAEIGKLDAGEYTASVTIETDDDSATATDSFSVRDSGLAVQSFSILDKGNENTFTVDATVAETAGNQTDGLTVTLAVDPPDGETVYDESFDPASELQDNSTTVTFGTNGTPEVGALTNTGAYTATITAETTNDGPVTATAVFHVLEAPHHVAPADRDAVLTEMAQDDDGTYVVTDDHELQAVTADPSAEYRLGADIDASLTEQWNDGSGFDPIGSNSKRFTGSFDGNGHTITGVTINRPGEDYVGLFGETDLDATVENVALETVDVSGSDNVGGLVGRNNGTVKGSYATASVSGSSSVGGLVGYNFDGTVERSYSTGSVEGDNYMGGLIGTNYIGTVSQSYATGTVSNGSDVGGLVGLTNSETINLSYWDTESTNQDDSAEAGNGSTGLTTAEMQGAAAETNMDALDFDDTWATASDDYPVLQAIDRDVQLEARQ